MLSNNILLSSLLAADNYRTLCCSNGFCDWCHAVLLQIEMVPSQDKATLHVEEWQGGCHRELDLRPDFCNPIWERWFQHYLLFQHRWKCFFLSPGVEATWTREHLSLSLELSTGRTSWCRAVGCRPELLVGVIELSFVMKAILVLYMFLKINSVWMQVQSNLDGDLHFSGGFSCFACVISCLYTFSSNHLVCTAQLSTHRTMLSHVITVLFISVIYGLLDWWISLV